MARAPDSHPLFPRPPGGLLFCTSLPASRREAQCGSSGFVAAVGRV